jgi:hypothetical protein
MNKCTTTIDYQMIDEGRNITEEGQLKGSLDFSELWMHRLTCQTRFNIVLPDNPYKRGGLADSQT